MVVTQVVGVGIFLAPATLVGTVGSGWAAVSVWLAMGLLSLAGALCYAELSTRYPEAGGGYVFLREAFGRRTAFVYGWMALLVVDPGVTAALGIGLGRYLLATLGGTEAWVGLTAVAAIVAFGLLTLLGMRASTRVMQVTAACKLLIVVLLAGAAVLRPGALDVDPGMPSNWSPAALAPALVAAFFAFGGWWDLGRMSEEVQDPGRTLPRAFVGGVVLVTAMYTLVSLALMATPVASATGEAMVLATSAAIFGDTAGRVLSGMVVVAVAGSLAATLLGAPRLYLAMARDGLFPTAFAARDPRRGTLPAATIVQVVLASALALTGSFEGVLGYFVPATVFFLGLSAAAILRLPRPSPDETAYRAPFHPVTVVLFLALVALMLVLFAAGQPLQTLAGAIIVLLGVPVSRLFVPSPTSSRTR